MQISAQTDIHKYRKSVATEKIIIFKKMSLKFRNPKFNIFCKITFFYIKCQPFRVSEVNKAILEQLKVKVGILLYASIF